MQGWRGYLRLKAQSKTGLSAGLLVWTLIGLACAAATLCFVILAVFIRLAERYGTLSAALVLGAFFFSITVIAVVACALAHRRTVRRAKLELASRSDAPWLDPRLAGVTLQVSRAIGWRKLAPLLAVGILAAGIGLQWFGRTSEVSTKPRLVA